MEDPTDENEWFAAFEAGGVEVTRAAIMRLGTKKFGQAPGGIKAVVHAIKSHTRLRRILDHIFDATNWADFIASA